MQYVDNLCRQRSEISSEDKAKKELNKRVAIGVRGVSTFDLDNRTITLSENVAERTGVASRGLDLNPDNASNLPFEPNNLNGFQAFMARMDQLFANKYAHGYKIYRFISLLVFSRIYMVLTLFTGVKYSMLYTKM